MIRRTILFAFWAFLGMVLSYAALYLLTPYGLVLIAAVLVISMFVPAPGGTRMPEILGLLAGPGAFSFLIAATTDSDPAPFALAGAVIVVATLTVYVVVGRARCARSR